MSCNIHINMYKLAGLANAELYLTSQDNVQWRKIHDWLENNTDDIDEEVNWVYSTDSMSYEDIYKAAEFSCFINTFHLRGFTNVIAERYNKKGNLSYEQFYEGLYEYWKIHTLWITLNTLKVNMISGITLVRVRGTRLKV